MAIPTRGTRKRFVIALKYEGESDYRYLVATDMTWRTMDITQAYTLRWLVEVFFEDWKLYEGWGREAKRLDEEGSSRGLILSLKKISNGCAAGIYQDNTGTSKPSR